MFYIHILSALHTTRAALPYLQKTTKQYIVTGSAAGRRHIKGSNYVSTKWFSHGFAGNPAKEMAEWGSR